jgi:hypothetical protein
MNRTALTVLMAGLAGALMGALLLNPAPTFAQAQSTAVQDAKGTLIVGSAGDLQNVNNLVYVVHKRPMTEREKAIMTAWDRNFPEERITLSVYRMNENKTCSLHYERDITIDGMLLGSDQAVVNDVERRLGELRLVHDKVKNAEPVKKKESK